MSHLSPVRQEGIKMSQVSKREAPLLQPYFFVADDPNPRDIALS